MNRSQRAELGITLVELMVVVTIIAVLGGLAAVTVRGERYRHAEGFASQVKTQLEAAGQRAVARSRIQRIEVHSDQIVLWEGCGAPEPDDPCPPTGMKEPDDLVVVERIAPPSPELSLYGMSEETEREGNADPPGDTSLPGVIDFFPDGTAQAATLFLDHEHSEDERHRIGVFRATGYVHVWRGWD